MEINIAIVTIDEPLYIPVMLQRLIDSSPESMVYRTVVIVPARPKKMTLYKFILNQIDVFGKKDFCNLVVKYLRSKISNTLLGREFSVAKVARNRDIPVLYTSSLRDEDLLLTLKSLSLDVIISIASSRIFGKDMLSIPILGCLNVHAGKLPKYRGINPSFWALLNQEGESAITVHFMNEKIDDGDIIKQDVFSIKNMITLNQIYLRVLEIAPQTVIKSLLDIQARRVVPIKNDSLESTYYSFPTKADGERFRSLGLSFF